MVSIIKRSKFAITLIFGFFIFGFYKVFPKSVESTNFVVDRHNEKIPKGYAVLKGESVLKEIKIVQEPAKGFKKELVFSFNKLKGFTHSKKTKNGRDIFELVIDGLDRDNDLADKIFDNLSKLTLYDRRPVFDRTSINFIGKTADNKAYFPQLRLLFESNPEKVAVDVIPELESRTIKIEIIDHGRFAMLKKEISAPDQILLFSLDETGPNFKKSDKIDNVLVFFSEPRQSRIGASSFTGVESPSGKVFDSIFSCAKDVFSSKGAQVFRAHCRQNVDQKKLWQCCGMGAGLTISVNQIYSEKIGNLRLVLNTNFSNKILELNISKSHLLKDDLVRQNCLNFFENLKLIF